MVKIPGFKIFSKAKTVADILAEPKKNGALRRELRETNNVLVFLLESIDRFNDDNEAPMCPEGREACTGNCMQCWYGAASGKVHREEA